MEMYPLVMAMQTYEKKEQFHNPLELGVACFETNPYCIPKCVLKYVEVVGVVLSILLQLDTGLHSNHSVHVVGGTAGEN